jgi:aspartyl-tRNA(Asn)/glutamyl-tRNA(Gln) amidotransferase subunit C
MTLSRSDIDRLARLARLRLSDEDAESMRAELSSIVGHFTILRSIGATPTSEPGMAGAPPRPDIVAPDPLLVPIDETAPEWVDGYFRVPNPPGVRSAGPG